MKIYLRIGRVFMFFTCLCLLFYGRTGNGFRIGRNLRIIQSLKV